MLMHLSQGQSSPVFHVAFLVIQGFGLLDNGIGGGELVDDPSPALSFDGGGGGGGFLFAAM